jgi:hypothetical protein
VTPIRRPNVRTMSKAAFDALLCSARRIKRDP